MRALSLILVLIALPAAAAETVTFEAADGTEVTADLYRPDGPSETALLLFHMAGASRGEYAGIAPRLADMGYLALAVDQRSGGTYDGVANRTAAQFAADPGFAAAIPDLRAAARYARETLGAARLGAVGSSYSASLVLVLAARDPDFADAVVAFSPGEYFDDSNFVRRDARTLTIPAFLTGARGERGRWAPIHAVIPGPKTGYRSEGAGHHGVTALRTAAGPEYWAALEVFLTRYLPPR